MRAGRDGDHAQAIGAGAGDVERCVAYNRRALARVGDAVASGAGAGDWAEVVAKLGVDIPLAKRDPHYFLPTQDTRYLLFGSDQAEMQRQFVSFFSEADWQANQAMQAELGELREDVAGGGEGGHGA